MSQRTHELAAIAFHQVGKRTGVGIRDIKGPYRPLHVVRARHLVWRLMLNYGLSQADAAAATGHSTYSVISSLRDSEARRWRLTADSKSHTFALWQQGKRTDEIAEILRVHESAVYNALAGRNAMRGAA